MRRTALSVAVLAATALAAPAGASAESDLDRAVVHLVPAIQISSSDLTKVGISAGPKHTPKHKPKHKHKPKPKQRRHKARRARHHAVR